jgi:hypothetical protein
VLDRTCPSDEVVTATKVICDVELPIRVEVNVVLLVLLSLGLEDVGDGTEGAEDGVVLVKVELGLARVVGVAEAVVGWLVVVVGLTVVVVAPVSVVGA